MSTVWTGYGRPAYDALRAAVAQHKRADPLAPVTVLVPGNLAGVHVRRALAHGFGGHPGVAGLDVLTVDRLADRIAAPALAGSGRRPITEPVLAAVWRRVLAGDPGVFGPVAAHPSTVRALATAHRDLREVNDAGLNALCAGGPVAADLVRLHRAVVTLLHENWYDIVDLRRLAARAPGPDELVIPFLPQDVPASAEALLEAIENKTVIAGVERESAPTAILHASDADDEVRCVVRRLATTLRRVPAHRIAVLYGSGRPYMRLLADHLRAAGIRWNGTGVQPTAERTLARMLPEVLATQHTGWQRADVMRLLADAPAVTSTATWERISRAAGVVGGDDWETRLKAYAGEREADAADELRVFVADLRERLREGEGLTNWPALADWGRATQAALVGELEERHVPEDQIRANAAVVRILEAMAGLESVEPSADLGLLGLTLDLELAGDRPRHGRMGDGVLVGPLADAIGIDADAVFVLGLSEDLVPGRPGTDALLPDEVRELAGGQLPLKRERIARRRRHVWAAFAAAPEVTASYARGDLRRSTTRLPSRWLRGPVAKAGESERAESASFAESLTRTDELASEQEWRIRAAAAHTLTQDHVVDLGVHLREQRHCDLLTRFDGDLSAHRTPDPTDGTILSPTALEAWSRCPHSYFVEKLLRVRPIETPEEQLTISPIERGNLYHETLDRFFVEQDAAGAVPGGATAWSPGQRQSLRRIALAVADDLTVRGATGHRLLWAQELAGVLSRLDQYLDADEEMRAATGRKQIRSELAFGLHGEPPVPIALPDGRTLLLRGSADRVDTGPDGLVVVDFKSGSKTAFAGLGADDPTLSGAKLQLPVYGYAARQALGSLQDVSAEYWFVHRDAGQRIGLPLTPAVETAFLAAVTVIADGMAGGLFPHRPPVDDGRSGRVPCGYCDPDALGADEHRERWERKRADPRLAGYVALIGGTS
ncbi:MAG: PD-(D/E)XK nuclease family protein [Actinoplanes sp.]